MTEKLPEELFAVVLPAATPGTYRLQVTEAYTVGSTRFLPEQSLQRAVAREGSEGPAGTDRRWKLAAEMALGQELKTPRELINAVHALLAKARAAGEVEP